MDHSVALNNKAMQTELMGSYKHHMASKTKQVLLEAKKLRVYTDGSVDRAPQPIAKASQFAVDGVVSKDVVINPITGVTGRIYFSHDGYASSTKLPLLFYYHGGGFCTGSACQVQTHNFLQSLCKVTRTLVVGVDYRLSPEYRLPTQYEDCIDALFWAAKGEDDWIAKHGNLTDCFLSGESSGGNHVHHVGVRLGCMAPGSRPKLIIRGLILVQPFFGSQDRTSYEEEYVKKGPQNELLARWYDILWKLSLPHGADRNSPYSNPRTHILNLASPVKVPPMLIAIAGLDLLKDRGLMCAELARTHMKSQVEVMVEEDQDHNYHIYQPNSPQQSRLLSRISQFISSHSSVYISESWCVSGMKFYS